MLLYSMLLIIQCHKEKTYIPQKTEVHEPENMETYLIKTLLQPQSIYKKYTTSEMTNMKQVDTSSHIMNQFFEYCYKRDYYSLQYEYNPDHIRAYKIDRIKNILRNIVHSPYSKYRIDTINTLIDRQYTYDARHQDGVLKTIHDWFGTSIFKKILATITQEGIYSRTSMYKAFIENIGEYYAVNNLQAKNIMKDFKYDNKNALDKDTSDNEQYVNMIKEEHNKLFDRYKTKIKKIPTLQQGASVIWCIQTVKLLEELSRIIAVQKHFETLIYLICRLPHNVPDLVRELGNLSPYVRCEDDREDIEIYHPTLNIIKEYHNIDELMAKIRTLEEQQTLCLQRASEIKSYLAKKCKIFENIKYDYTTRDRDEKLSQRLDDDVVYALRQEIGRPKEQRKSKFTDKQLCNMLCMYYNFNACTYIKNNSK